MKTQAELAAMLRVMKTQAELDAMLPWFARGRCDLIKKVFISPCRLRWFKSTNVLVSSK